MATIASPSPRSHVATTPPINKDHANLQLHDERRATPLPQYEKTQAVPFTLTLQEEKNKPGQFQLVVSIDQKSTDVPSNGEHPPQAPAKKLYENLKGIPSLGYDASPLYRIQKPSPPVSPEQESQGWSDLDAIPPEFLQKVVPDWKITFSRNDSTASNQSRKLADIRARIKKSGKGFVVRLLKGSNNPNNTDEVAEVHLGHRTAEGILAPQELDTGSCPPVELDAVENAITPAIEQTNVFEIGTSSESGVRGSSPTPSVAHVPYIPNWLNQTSTDLRPRNSLSEEGFSDAETLTQEIRPFVQQIEDDQTDLEPFSTLSSRIPTRTASISSIVKTPTRGLTVVGPVKRVEKGNRARATNARGKTARVDLNRSGAHKSFKRRSPHSSKSGFATLGATQQAVSGSSHALKQRPALSTRSQSEHHVDVAPLENDTWHHPIREKRAAKEKVGRQPSAEDLLQPTKQKSRLRLQTDVPRPKSANTSPCVRRKRPARAHQSSSSSSSVHFTEENQHIPSPAWSEADPSERIREALQRAFGTTEGDDNHVQPHSISRSVPQIEEQVDEEHIGNIPLPFGMEIRSAPVNTRSPILKFWGLAIGALSERLFEGLHALRDRYGSEPPVAPNKVRVRWTCPCGEPLYDDFIERRPGAARLLEAYLNRPRSHTPTSSTGRTSTSSTMSSVFSSVSTASTLATPSSTHGGGPSSWGRNGDLSRFSPSRLRSADPFSVRIGGYPEDQWLLTCANEGRFTPKIVHLDVNVGRIKSDKDLALALREHYEQLNRGWLKWARLRGLTTIEFVQFEVHRNRFADIRATPSMPPTSSSTSAKSPSSEPYSFEPVDLIPPVGSTYLVHLFQHPSDYDGELITYLRSPKRRERLEFGMGWGINLVEGFLAQKVWMGVLGFFAVGSAAFAVLWTVKMGDVQGAFGVAGWILTLAGLIVGGLQAWLE